MLPLVGSNSKYLYVAPNFREAESSLYRRTEERRSSRKACDKKELTG